MSNDFESCIPEIPLKISIEPDICDLAILSALRRVGLPDAIRAAREDLPALIGVTLPTDYEVSTAIGVIRSVFFEGIDTMPDRKTLTTDTVLVLLGMRSQGSALSNPGLTVVVADAGEVERGAVWHVSELADRRIDVTVCASDIRRAIAQAYPELANEPFEIHDNASVNDLSKFLHESVTGHQLVRAVNKMAKRRQAKSEQLKRDAEPAKTARKITFPVTEPGGISLSELPGFSSARPWAMQLASDLQAYLRGEIPWSEIDRGALLVGPPGCGKSTLMRSLASTAGVPMIFTGFADFSNVGEGHMGTILKGISALFTQVDDLLQERRAVIVAIDEIDSVPPRGTGDHSDYWGPIVNAFLAAINGRPGMIVVGTANSANVDPALVRPGRMDRVIKIANPGSDEIAPILRHHIGHDVTGLGSVSGILRGSSAADLEQIARSARRRARKFGRILSMDDINAVIDEMRPRIVDADLAYQIAFHEAGHAVAQLSSPHVVGVDITLSETYCAARAECRDGSDFQSIGYLSSRLVELLAGRVAERRHCGTVSRGAGGQEAESDLRRATRIAIELETQHGVGVTGLVHVTDDKDHALLNPRIHDAVRRRLEDAQTAAERLIDDRWHVVGALALALVRDRYISSERVKEIVERADAVKRQADVVLAADLDEAALSESL
jgi:energy-coupling factor transporter ATP-binding protein EcfA2